MKTQCCSDFIFFIYWCHGAFRDLDQPPAAPHCRKNRAFCRNTNILNRTSRDTNRACWFNFNKVKIVTCLLLKLRLQIQNSTFLFLTIIIFFFKEPKSISLHVDTYTTTLSQAPVIAAISQDLEFKGFR